jgi:hypothetical protein
VIVVLFPETGADQLTVIEPAPTTAERMVGARGRSVRVTDLDAADATLVIDFHIALTVNVYAVFGMRPEIEQLNAAVMQVIPPGEEVTT